jgi:hypothetical protein
VLARLVFDFYRRLIARDSSQSAGMAADIAAWQRVLIGKWKPGAIRH